MFERPLLSNIHSLLQGDSYYYPLKSTGCFLQKGRRADFFFFFFWHFSHYTWDKRRHPTLSFSWLQSLSVETANREKT